MEIEEKRILITGASRGLGRALVQAALQAGAAEVVAGARRPDSLARFIRRTGSDGRRITPLRLDVTRDSDVEGAAALGRVDILINNAGTAAYGGVFKGKPNELAREMEVNYLGVLRMVRALAPAMIDHGDGLVVNIGSMLGKVNLPALGTYCATKAALLSLAHAMRADLEEHGVRVMTVLPGTLDTDMSSGFDIPKLGTAEAAAEILEAIRSEEPEAAIGEEARAVLGRLAADPDRTQREFARMRA